MYHSPLNLIQSIRETCKYRETIQGEYRRGAESKHKSIVLVSTNVKSVLISFDKKNILLFFGRIAPNISNGLGLHYQTRHFSVMLIFYKPNANRQPVFRLLNPPEL